MSYRPRPSAHAALRRQREGKPNWEQNRFFSRETSSDWQSGRGEGRSTVLCSCTGRATPDATKTKRPEVFIPLEKSRVTDLDRQISRGGVSSENGERGHRGGSPG